MDRYQTFESAKQLNQVSKDTFLEYQDRADLLITEMNTVMLARPDLKDLVGENNIDMMRDNHANHVRFIASILKHHDSDVLIDTVLWVFRAYRSHGFSSNYWAAQLNTWIVILKKVLTSETYREVYPYYEWMQINIPLFVMLSDEKLEASNSLHH